MLVNIIQVAFLLAGGHGITIYSPWFHYSTFRIWAISNGFRKGMTLDRIDNNSNYEPVNCQWLTKGQHVIKTMTVDNCIKGENSVHAILTSNDVKQIRNLYKENVSITKISKKFNICHQHAGDICHYKRWKHI